MVQGTLTHRGSTISTHLLLLLEEVLPRVVALLWAVVLPWEEVQELPLE